jgi:hypothetical protein
VNTRTITLNVTASDPEPVSGTIGVSLGNDHWVWEDTALLYTAGLTTPDSAAGDGSAWTLGAGTEGLLYSPPITVLPAAGLHRALFRIRVPTAALTSTHEFATLVAGADGSDVLYGIRYLRGTDFKLGDAYQEIALDFSGASGAIGLRASVDSAFDVWVDRVRVVSYPADVAPQMQWTLPAREGGVTVTAKYVDRAGNLSGDVQLAMTITDEGPPGEWRQFRLDETACTVQVRDAIAGLDVGSAAYRFSMDGGVTWGDWTDATCSGTNGSHDWETIAAPVPPPAASVPGASLVQYRIRDVAAVANQGASPAYAVWRVFLPVVTSGQP